MADHTCTLTIDIPKQCTGIDAWAECTGPSQKVLTGRGATQDAAMAALQDEYIQLKGCDFNNGFFTRICSSLFANLPTEKIECKQE